jgi:tight adherence protein C
VVGISAVGDAFSSPFIFALLIGATTILFWLALAPARPARPVDARLDDYLERGDVVEATELQKPFVTRAVMPPLRRLLRMLGGFLPKRSLAHIGQMLVYAGRPGGLTALDFVGLRVLAALAFAGGYFFLVGEKQAGNLAFFWTMIVGLVGYLLPMFWLRRRVRGRQREIARALPDALDMLTIGVEAGLAFESALLRVGEQWDNALTREFRRAVAEMRVGTPRADALEHMVERTGVEELASFVAVLVQSNQLGVSISQVLHTQSEQMRVRRRQRAEELARQASVKMVVVMVFFIFPSLFIVILGPVVPRIMSLLRIMSGG